MTNKELLKRYKVELDSTKAQVERALQLTEQVLVQLHESVKQPYVKRSKAERKAAQDAHRLLAK